MLVDNFTFMNFLDKMLIFFQSKGFRISSFLMENYIIIVRYYLLPVQK